jgi:hypothetical protein
MRGQQARFLRFDNKITLLYLLLHTFFHCLHQVWDRRVVHAVSQFGKRLYETVHTTSKCGLPFKTQNTYLLTEKPCRHTLLGQDDVPHCQLSNCLPQCFGIGIFCHSHTKCHMLFLCFVHAIRVFFHIWSYMFNRSVYILYHAPNICTNKLEISFHIFMAGVTQMIYRVNEFFSVGCFILLGVTIQGTIIWRNLKLNFMKEATVFDLCGPKLIWSKDLMQKYIYIKVNHDPFINLILKHI